MTRSSTTGKPLPSLPLALTMGEPAGIGPDVTLKAWLSRNDVRIPHFYVIADPQMLTDRARAVGLDVPISVIGKTGEAARVFATGLPVMPLPCGAPVATGKPSEETAQAVIESIKVAAGHARDGKASAVVTNPISKAVLYGAGFKFPGHTEFLAELAGPDIRSVMMLSVPGLRVVPVTIHIALARVSEALTQRSISLTAKAVHAALRNDFGIEKPRIAVAGLNPHAGESGMLGSEEDQIIRPAIAALRQAGICVTGPFPADTLFHAAARETYDAVLCMYHDQALIPLKTLNFHEGVNITLGLPWVRTSPDHGTAFDIAGTGRADPRSLIAALRTANSMAAHRAQRRQAASAPE